jgi:hypothetical protein
VGEDPSQIREEIEATRERMTETADALAAKANMRARAKEKAQARRDAVLARVRAVAPQNRDQAIGQAHAAQQALAGRARNLAQNPQQAVDSARSAALAAKQQPQWLALACGVVALLGTRKVGYPFECHFVGGGPGAPPRPVARHADCSNMWGRWQ